MSSKGYIRIPESQLRLERLKKQSNKTWHNNIMNLLLGNNVCGSCLRLDNDLVNWEAEFVLLRYECKTENSLKNIMTSTFGPSVTNIIPTTNFCQKCVDIILTAHLFTLEIRNNNSNIQRKLKEISQQMNWTDYLDETGCLSESINSKIVEDSSKTEHEILSHATTQSEGVIGTNHLKDSTESTEKEIKTHKIILHNESLKIKLLQNPDMHKFLSHRVDFSPKRSEHKLPVGITIRRVEKHIDISDFAPHDLLELNWTENEDDRVKLDTQIPSSQLHSNEALIMNLMEKAKTDEKHIHFEENLKLKVNKSGKIPLAEPSLNDSLSVKLIHGNTNENYSDNDDLVPQDLLELTWPEEQNCNTEQKTKIPVKKLNFNEALTVKFIPGHKLRGAGDGAPEIAPHELLELNWNEETGHNNKVPIKKPDEKHNIDLTQWLQDQGMNTIKSKLYTANILREDNLNVETTSTKFNNENSINKEIFDTTQKTGNHTLEDLLEYNIIVKNPELMKEQDNNIIRCPLCKLSFIQFESYWSHYKTHNITESAKCYRCAASFPVIEFLVEHMLLRHSESIAYCTLCYALLKQDKVPKHMVDCHAKKVEIINASSILQAQLSNGYCKKCNISYANIPDSPHVCVFNTECTECKKDCVHKTYLTSYIDQIKANRNVFKCIECAYLYRSKQDIIRHANYVHLRNKVHQCKLCNARFSLQGDLDNHSDTCHFRCTGCKKAFPDKIFLNVHECANAARCLKCDLCGEKFMALKSCAQHQETSLIVDEECVVCHILVPNKCNMARHMRNVHHLCFRREINLIVYECTICETDFKGDLDFSHHVCLYECQICSKRFSVKAIYEKHLKAHLDVQESLKCNVCGQQLIDKYALAHHMLSHSDYEKCPVCFIYIEKITLTEHIESHADPKDKLKCPHCALVCENQNQFEVHVNRFHLLNRPYQCDICKKSFYSKHKLREHIRLHSSEARPEKCPLCSKKFARKATLEKHIKLHSTGQLYDCDVCKKKYISAALLNKHRKSHEKVLINISMPETSQS